MVGRQMMQRCLFDNVISNPPYQVDTSTDRQSTASNIFHLFYHQSVQLCDNVVMIFPAGRWMQRAFRGMVAAECIYPTVHHCDVYHNDGSRRVFPNVTLHDGVSVVRSGVLDNPYVVLDGVVVNRPDASGILPMSSTGATMMRQHKFTDMLISRKCPTTLFRVPSRYMERNMDMLASLTDADDVVTAYIANEKPGSAKRVVRTVIPREDVHFDDISTEVFHSYKVVTSQGNASKKPEETTYSVIEKDTAVGTSWVIVGYFPTEEEAHNYKRYLDSGFVRALLADSKGGKYGKWGYFVPDLGDYTDNNPDVDFSLDLDQQLITLFAS